MSKKDKREIRKAYFNSAIRWVIQEEETIHPHTSDSYLAAVRAFYLIHSETYEGPEFEGFPQPESYLVHLLLEADVADISYKYALINLVTKIVKRVEHDSGYLREKSCIDIAQWFEDANKQVCAFYERVRGKPL